MASVTSVHSPVTIPCSFFFPHSQENPGSPSLSLLVCLWNRSGVSWICLALGKPHNVTCPASNMLSADTAIRDIHGTPQPHLVSSLNLFCSTFFLSFTQVKRSAFFKCANMSGVIHIDSGLLSKYFHCNFNQEINGKSF